MAKASVASDYELRREIHVFRSQDEAARANMEYALSLSTDERMAMLEYLRRGAYGDAATSPLQRVLRIVPKE